MKHPSKLGKEKSVLELEMLYMYINMCIYVYIHTYVKWMSTGIMLACHKNG